MKKEGKNFVCEECGIKYEEKKWAEKCEKFCRKNKSCDLGIIKYSIKDNKK